MAEGVRGGQRVRGKTNMLESKAEHQERAMGDGLSAKKQQSGGEAPARGDDGVVKWGSKNRAVKRRCVCFGAEREVFGERRDIGLGRNVSEMDKRGHPVRRRSGI